MNLVRWPFFFGIIFFSFNGKKMTEQSSAMTEQSSAFRLFFILLQRNLNF